MRLLLKQFSLYAIMIVLGSPGFAHDWDGARPDAHAPISVMGDHTHAAGEWMLSYRYMFMDMDGHRVGSHRVGTQQVLDDFMVAPTKMSMEMHGFGAMWAPCDRATLMVMLPFIVNQMDHVTRMGGRFTTRSDGVGDAKLAALVKLWQKDGQMIHVNLGLSMPTGSIDEKDQTPMGRAQLPYPMQLGSGTFDFLPGLTYLGQQDDWSWGGQLAGIIRLGENSNDYSLGNRLLATVWGARRWCEWFSSSLRLNVEDWGNIDGADPLLNPALVPTADPNRRGGTRIDIGFGVNLYGRRGVVRGHRLAVEWMLPFYQDLDGPQLETDWMLIAGWQKAW